MTDIVLNNIGSGFNRSRINNNFDVLEEVVNNGIVHLDGGNNIMRQNLDMNSKRLLNLPDPESGSEPVPYEFLLQLLGESGAAVTSPLVQPRQVGDGATTTFATPTSTKVNPSFFFVYLDGVKQRPTTDYSVNSDGTLEFTEAPPMASLIDITLYTPTFKDIDGNEEVIATGTTTPRSLADRFGDVVNVKDFESLVVGDDWTEAFNAALQVVRGAIYKVQLGVIETGAVKLLIPHGTYVCNGSINATNIRGLGWVVDGDGAQIISKATGKAAFDLLGSRWGTFKGLTIYGDEENRPAVGWQYGRVGFASNSCDNHKFISCKTNGFFSITAVYNFASETDSHYHPEYWNFDNSLSSYAFVNDGNNSFSGLPISDFVDTSLIPAFTPMSNIQHTFYACDIRKQVGGPCMYFSKSNQVHFSNGYAVSKNDAVVVLDAESNQFNDMYFDLHCESGGLKHCFKIKNQADQAGTDVRLRDFTYIDHAPFASDEIFNIDSNVSNLRMVDATIKIPRVGILPTNGLSNSATKLKVYGDLYAVSTILSNFQLFGGLKTDTITTVANFPLGDYKVIDSLGNHFFKGRIDFVSNTSSTPSGANITNNAASFREGALEMPPLGAVPSNLVAGVLAVDNGANWSGVNATGRSRYVQYDGVSWLLL